MDLTAVRTLLRAERKARRWSLDQMAEASGVNRTTIQDIETNKDGKPQLETITKLIEAMPPLTVSSFFAKIESGERGHESGSATTVGGLPRDRAVSAVAPELPPDLEELGSALARFVHAIARQQAPAADPARPTGRPSARKTRRRRAAGS